jgi:hypothetical protein
MSSTETPAAHLARLKVQHPAWTIWRAWGEETEYRAMPPRDTDQVLLTAPTVPELEVAIQAAERRFTP